MGGGTYLDGKEVLDGYSATLEDDVTAGDDVFVGDDIVLSGTDSTIALAANTTASGIVERLVCTPGSARTDPVLKVEALGSNWGGGSSAFYIVAEDGSCDYIKCFDGSAHRFSVTKAGNVELDGNIQLDLGGSIVTTTNGSITLLPNGSGISKVGDAGSTLHTLNTNDDLFVAGRIESTGGTFVGDATNYCETKDDGEINLHGTARVTKKLIIPTNDLSKGGTAPDQTILGDYIGYSYDIGDDSVLTTELPVDWAAGTDLTLEVDWYINEAYATDSGEINWQATWSACPHDASEAVDAPTHTGTVTSGDINIPATAKYLTENDVGTISGASISAGDEIGLTFSRIALVGGNDPGEDPVAVNVYLKYTADKLGTAT